MSREEEFRDFIGARWGQLLRTAYLVTGDPARGEGLLRAAFVRARRGNRPKR